ncbi:MAG: hypothetical protein GVY10_11960 [Verrucomicrobia bacterium]|jgi:hypothetical protein|nr:hypothetical protein [Verrucomicrobiota bacterium]
MRLELPNRRRGRQAVVRLDHDVRARLSPRLLFPPPADRFEGRFQIHPAQFRREGAAVEDPQPRGFEGVRPFNEGKEGLAVRLLVPDQLQRGVQRDDPHPLFVQPAAQFFRCAEALPEQVRKVHPVLHRAQFQMTEVLRLRQFHDPGEVQFRAAKAGKAPAPGRGILLGS